MEEFDFTTVQRLADGDIVLVGEEHRNSNSEDLSKRVADEIQPQTYAIEQGSKSTGFRIGTPGPNSGAMGHFSRRAKRENKPLLCIDENRSDYRSMIPDEVSWHKLLSVGNEFSHEIEEDGDMNWRSIIDARENVRSEFGPETYEAFYIFREKGMVARLNRALREYETPIVVAIGTFHILALRDFYQLVDEEKELGEDRVFFLEDHSVEEPATASA